MVPERLTAKEASILRWYNALNDTERQAVDHWLATGDPSLIALFRDCSERLQRFRHQPFRCGVKQRALPRR